jgi:BMFP domain-containing protein YqiC
MPAVPDWKIKHLRHGRWAIAPTWRNCRSKALYRGAVFFTVEIPTMFTANSLDDLARRLSESVPESLRSFRRDLEGNFKAVLQAQLSKMDLVSRQEFDVQAALLARTQASLADLEARIKELEAKLKP